MPIHDLISCKQLPGEDFYSFVSRLFKIYLACEIDSAQLFVSTAMNNGDPKVTQVMKLVNPKWATMSPPEFIVDVKKRASSRFFNTKGGLFAQTSGTTTPVSPMFPAFDNPAFQTQDQGCFHCGDPFHWKSECPHRRGARGRFQRWGKF